MITAEMLSDYQITRSNFSSKEETAAALALRRALTERLGKEPAIDTDWDNGKGIPEKEILFGKTNRPETAALAEKFARSGADCAYGVVGRKVILYANDAEGLCKIVDKLSSDVLGAAPCAAAEEKAPVLCEGCFAGYTCSDRLLLTDGSETVNALRSDVLWGVNGHNKAHAPYGESNTEKILRLAAEMGSTIYRINYNPTTPEMLSYIYDIIDRCHTYGMKVMMCLDNFRGTVEEITERMTYIAENMNGKVDYIQVFNETDVWAAQTDDGTFYNPTNWTGMTTEYYNPERVAIAIEKMRAALDVFHSIAPDTKLVINAGARHFPIFDRYVEAGLTWDIIGFDFYDVSMFSTSAFMKEMEERYPGFDFMICEFNYPSNNGKYTEEEQAVHLERFFREMNDFKSDRMLAVIVYELLDEVVMQADPDQWYGEAHFGIVHTTQDGKPGEVKLGYRRLQEMLCGGIAEYRTVYTPITVD